MTPFDLVRAGSVAEAVQASGGAARFIAGGTNLLDLMKEHVERPARLVDITRLPLTGIEETPGGGLRLGALATNSAVARDERVLRRYPLLAGAILAGASPQLRNMASTGGNLLQRRRGYHFYDAATPCNRREPGSGCGAIGGRSRIHALLGASGHCAVELPPEGFAAHHTYLKLRDRLSYAFALVSVAAALRIEDGRIAEARLALGGVAHRPWRVPEAEALLAGRAPSRAAFGEVAERVLEGAQGQGDNDFKIPMAGRAILRALEQAAAGTPQSRADKRIR